MKGVEAGILAASEEIYGITEEDIPDIAEAIPEGNASEILIIKHLWAKNLKRVLRNQGGTLVTQSMFTPELLIAVGDELAEVVKLQRNKNLGLVENLKLND